MRGVSPVVGVILVIAITVVLSAVVSVFVLGIGSDSEDSTSAAGVDISTNDGEYTITVTSMGNTDELVVQCNDGSTEETVTDVGTYSGTVSGDCSELLIIADADNNGSGQVLQSTDTGVGDGGDNGEWFTAKFTAPDSAAPGDEITLEAEGSENHIYNWVIEDEETGDTLLTADGHTTTEAIPDDAETGEYDIILMVDHDTEDDELTNSITMDVEEDDPGPA